MWGPKIIEMATCHNPRNTLIHPLIWSLIMGLKLIMGSKKGQVSESRSVMDSKLSKIGSPGLPKTGPWTTQIYWFQYRRVFGQHYTGALTLEICFSSYVTIVILLFLFICYIRNFVSFALNAQLRKEWWNFCMIMEALA